MVIHPQPHHVNDRDVSRQSRQGFRLHDNPHGVNDYPGTDALLASFDWLVAP